MATFTTDFPQYKINPYSRRQWESDVECICCGRGIRDRSTAHVVITQSGGRCSFFLENAQNPPNAVETITFRPISERPVGRDSVEWGSFVGSHCAKRIPKEYKITQRKVVKEWIKAGQP